MVRKAWQLYFYNIHRAVRIHEHADGLSRRSCPNSCSHYLRMETKECYPEGSDIETYVDNSDRVASSELNTPTDADSENNEIRKSQNELGDMYTEALTVSNGLRMFSIEDLMKTHNDSVNKRDLVSSLKIVNLNKDK